MKELNAAKKIITLSLIKNSLTLISYQDIKMLIT